MIYRKEDTAILNWDFLRKVYEKILKISAENLYTTFVFFHFLFSNCASIQTNMNAIVLFNFSPFVNSSYGAIYFFCVGFYNKKVIFVKLHMWMNYSILFIIKFYKNIHITVQFSDIQLEDLKVTETVLLKCVLQLYLLCDYSDFFNTESLCICDSVLKKSE